MKSRPFAAAFFLLTTVPIAVGQSGAAAVGRFRQLDKNGDQKVTRAETDNARWFDRLDRNSDNVITLEEARLWRPAAPAGSRTSSITRELNVAYGKDAKQKLDIYTPADAKDLPVMIYIHGGGWHRGDKAAVGEKPTYFTSRDFVFVSLNYRLVPDVDILMQLQDSADAVGWVHKQIDKYGGDPEQLHLIGHSAGAHHVAILATNERFVTSAGVPLDRIKSVVELDTQALDIPTLMNGNRNNTYTNAFGRDEKVWKQISPLHNVTNAKGIPPFFLVVADRRAAKIEQAKAFQKELRVAGVRCDFHEAPEHDHGSLDRSLGEPDDKVTEAMTKFHRSLLDR